MTVEANVVSLLFWAPFTKRLREVAVSLFRDFPSSSCPHGTALLQCTDFHEILRFVFCSNLSTFSVFGSYETKSDASHADRRTV